MQVERIAEYPRILLIALLLVPALTLAQFVAEAILHHLDTRGTNSIATE